jgi:hypothetical protein
MRYTIETAPRNGSIVILEDDASGTFDVAHWSPEAGKWIGEFGEPSEITPSHWHPCYCFFPFSLRGAAPQAPIGSEAVALRSAAAVEAQIAPSHARRGGFVISWNAAAVVAAVLVGIYFLLAVLHRHALEEEHVRTAALESELAMARRGTETEVALSRNTRGDEVAQLKQAAESATAKLQQEHGRAEALATELAQARRAMEQKPAPVEEKPAALEEKPATKQSEGVAPENSKPAIKPVETGPPNRRATSQDDGYGCQHYRTYDPASGTYKGYDGQRHSCP